MEDVMTERAYYFSDLLEMDTVGAISHLTPAVARMCNAPGTLAISSLPE